MGHYNVTCLAWSKEKKKTKKGKLMSLFCKAAEEIQFTVPNACNFFQCLFVEISSKSKLFCSQRNVSCLLVCRADNQSCFWKFKQSQPSSLHTAFGLHHIYIFFFNFHFFFKNIPVSFWNSMNRWNDVVHRSSSKFRQNNPRKWFKKVSQSTTILEKYRNPELVLRRTHLWHLGMEAIMETWNMVNIKGENRYWQLIYFRNILRTLLFFLFFFS